MLHNLDSYAKVSMEMFFVSIVTTVKATPLHFSLKYDW